jgi:hypothetical protein
MSQHIHNDPQTRSDNAPREKTRPKAAGVCAKDSTMPGPAETPSTPEPEDLVVILMECAVSSFVQALMTLIWGQLIFSLLGDLLKDMIPSAPPGLVGRAPPGLGAAGSWLAVEDHLLWILGGVFFALNARARFFRAQSDPDSKAAGGRLRDLAESISADWFKLLFSNALGALVAVWMLALGQEFSVTNWLLHLVIDPLALLGHSMSVWLLGSGRATSIQRWIDWYGENQTKFTFWLLYSAAICDDLGLPNLKTLARWAWNRARRRFVTRPRDIPA